jgi:DNA-binding transcriptional LysR family regulator
MIELRRLRAFVTVVEEGNITRAAERLFIQQPPLTRLLQGLEDELGVTLLQRLPRGVRVTEAGGVLFEEARALLARAERLREAVQRAARGEQGHIAIGFTSSAALHPFVPNLLRRYRDILPGITTQLEEAGSGELMEALLEQRLDAAFVRSPANGIPGLSVEPVLSEPMIVALPLGHRLAQETQQPLPLAELAHEAFILYRRPAGCTTPSWPPATAPASARASCRKRRACRPPSAWSAPGWGCQSCPARCGGWAATALSTAPSPKKRSSAPRFTWRCAIARPRRSSSAFANWSPRRFRPRADR